MRREIAAGILALVLMLVPRSVESHSDSRETVRQEYVGDESCRSCHSEKVQSYWSTAHHLTSQLPSKESIRGSFAKEKNVLKTSNPALYFRMESRADGFYQTSNWAFPPVSTTRSERFGVVIGSGRVGQTYLYWKDEQLFQLPVSYWVDLDSWINSPGYRDGTANFDRPVIPRCLECHTTYAQALSASISSNRYKPDSLILGISCERCHGPGRAHVEAMAAKKAAEIINPVKLSRESQMDVCAQCHGGRRIPTTDSFSYIPGEPLDKYYRVDQANIGVPVDVHGNQVALLRQSRCYQGSTNLVCTTCHDVHQPQRDVEAFSDRCVKCHRAENCGEYPKLREKIVSACVNCHMPVQASNRIITNSNGKKTRAMVRSHWIKVYEDSRTP